MKKLKTLSLGKSDSKFGIDLFSDSPVFLANLEKLHLESVSIKDVRFNKTKLETLRLINCEGFRDDLLSNFPATALARLEKVDLSQSDIRDGVLAYLSNLALGLQELILDDCVLVGGDFTLSKEAFSNLQVLSLKGSVVGPPRIGDQGIYEFLIRAKNLRELYLNQNSLITGSTFEKLPIGSLLFLKKLTLGLHFDKIGQLPEGALSRLNELHLYQTNISYEKLSSLILARTKDLKILGLKRCDNLESENLGQIVSTLSDLNVKTDKEPTIWSLPNLRQLLLETNIREQHACDLLLKTSKLQRLTLISDKVDGSRLSQLDSSVFSHLKFIFINNILRYREAIISKLPPENVHH